MTKKPVELLKFETEPNGGYPKDMRRETQRHWFVASCSALALACILSGCKEKPLLPAKTPIAPTERPQRTESTSDIQREIAMLRIFIAAKQQALEDIRSFPRA